LASSSTGPGIGNEALAAAGAAAELAQASAQAEAAEMAAARAAEGCCGVGKMLLPDDVAATEDLVEETL